MCRRLDVSDELAKFAIGYIIYMCSVDIAIRHTLLSDIPAVLRVFEIAKRYMRRTGNLSQWGDAYPDEAALKRDIARGWSRVIVRDGTVVATFCMMTEPEPTYAEIAGAWLNDDVYCTLHRVASDGSLSGVVEMATNYAAQRYTSVRIDTHRDNRPMQAAVLRKGYVHCGVITLFDGSPREAYQYTRPVLSDCAAEVLPLVDEEGHVVGRASRGECHGGSMLLHPVVHLHVLDGDGRLYLQKRPEWKDIQPGKWDTAVGGHVDYGEDVSAALRREAVEELGLRDVSPVHVCRYVFESSRERELVNVFVARVSADDVSPSAELDGGVFLTFDELNQFVAAGEVTPQFASEYAEHLLPFLRDAHL